MVKNKKRAFTLIELLVVISIIALLSSIGAASLNSTRAKARDAKRKADLKQIVLALELYFDANGKYPPGNCNAGVPQGYNCWNHYLSNNVTNANGQAWSNLAGYLAPYMPNLPRDPSNTPEGCAPHGTDANLNDGCPIYGYSYVTDATNASYPYHAYDLYTDLENANDPDACPAKTHIGAMGRIWCNNENGLYRAGGGAK